MANSDNVESTSLVTDESQLPAPAWQPGFRQTPLPAMILILMMLACMGASAGIVIASDKQIVASWSVGPAVLLALLSSIWNYSLSVALGICVAITWWRSALRGTTLESLHYIWNQGAGLTSLSALRSSVAARKVVLLAWLVVSVQIVNNPLLQRSTRIQTENIVVEDNMMLDMTQQLPDGWLGSIQNGSAGVIIGNRNHIATVQGWWKNEIILSRNETGYQCDGTCEGKVKGTGIDYNCTSTLLSLDLLAHKNVGSPIFAINSTMSTNSTGAPILVLTTLYTSAINDSCIATLNISSCSIEAAVIEYPIVIQNITVMLDKGKLDNTTIVSKYISAGDLPTAAKGQGAGPLEGLNELVVSNLAQNVQLLIDRFRNESLYNGGLIADLFFLPDASNYDERILDKCGLKWTDPTQYVFDSMHDFLFRASLNASTDTDIQTFSVQRTNLSLIFQSNYNYLAAALAVMMLPILAVLLQLWGWWELGRLVSLSPLEVAKAFRAPAMQQANDTLAADEILKLIGKTRVRYNGDSFSESAVELQGRGGDEK